MTETTLAYVDMLARGALFIGIGMPALLALTFVSMRSARAVSNIAIPDPLRIRARHRLYLRWANSTHKHPIFVGKR